MSAARTARGEGHRTSIPKAAARNARLIPLSRSGTIGLTPLAGEAVLASSRTARAGGVAAVAAHDFHREGGWIMSVMSIVWMIIVGFIVGVLARFFYPGAVNLGFWMTTLLGIGGSIVGGIVGGLFSSSPDGKFQPAGWILSIAGAMLLLWGYLNYFAK